MHANSNLWVLICPIQSFVQLLYFRSVAVSLFKQNFQCELEDLTVAIIDFEPHGTTYVLVLFTLA